MTLSDCDSELDYDCIGYTGPSGPSGYNNCDYDDINDIGLTGPLNIQKSDTNLYINYPTQTASISITKICVMERCPVIVESDSRSIHRLKWDGSIGPRVSKYHKTWPKTAIRTAQIYFL